MSDVSAVPLNLREMMNPAQVAAYLDVGLSTLAEWRKLRKNLPYYRRGRNVLYRKCDVEGYLAQTRVDPLPPTAVRVDPEQEMGVRVDATQQ